jgi:hypothetical protein
MEGCPNCPPGFVEGLPRIKIKKAVEVLDEEGKERFMIAMWEDGHVVVCARDHRVGDTHDCYTSSKPEGDKLFYIAQSYYAGLGFKIKPIEG